MKKCILVTGGAGFIGSCFVLQRRINKDKVINLDKLTYAGNMENLLSLANDDDHIFVRGDIGNDELVTWLLQTYNPDFVVNFAAESHVDRSILNPESFVRTNVLGTARLLRSILHWWDRLENNKKNIFRFLHISTDEVFGTLTSKDSAFCENTPYSPNSPYSATKAASDHLVRAFHETYGLPTLITNCSNNYGPRQFPEKLIPLVILNALEEKRLPIYGTGNNIRDWLHVEDHCRAISCVLENGRIGESYNIGGRAEKTNLQVVNAICSMLDIIKPRNNGLYSDLINFVRDRPGHDFRYAMDCSKIDNELGWKAEYDFCSGLKKTVRWYIENAEWVKNVRRGLYKEWINLNYAKRILNN